MPNPAPNEASRWKTLFKTLIPELFEILGADTYLKRSIAQLLEHSADSTLKEERADGGDVWGVVEMSRCEDHGAWHMSSAWSSRYSADRTRAVTVEGGAAILLGPFPDPKNTG